MLASNSIDTDGFDVCICGGGLAGLGLARQLKLESPNCKIVIIDRQARPLPVGAHKVGESLIEVGSHYLINTLQLGDYLKRVHKPKCGLRWFTREGGLPIENRTETGAPDFPLIPALQLDRGVYENDLRKMCVDSGITLVEGATIKNIEIRKDSQHKIDYALKDNVVNSIYCNWLVDAMGRRRFLAKKFGLTEPVGHNASATWWRIEGEWDVTKAVINPSADSDWKSRELGRRWFATNHFIDKGYWVWVIPLANHTSIGIVSDENIHPVAKRSSLKKSLDWLQEYEPHLFEWLKSAEVADFHSLKNFAHTSSQFYSHNRWAMVGEAALFADPYYSTGSDLIALQNNIVTRLILSDKKNELSEKDIAQYNKFVTEFFRGVVAIFEDQYDLFGNEYVHYIKTMWDLDFLTGPVGKIGFGPHVLDNPDDLPALTSTVKKWSDLNIAVQRLIREWAERFPDKRLDRSVDSVMGPSGLLVPNPQIFQTFTDQLKLRNAPTLVEQCEGTFWRFAEARAKWLFRQALEDLRKVVNGTEADLVSRALAEPINVFAIGLKPEVWKERGLFELRSGTTNQSKSDASQMDYIVPAVPPADQLVAGYPRAIDCFWSNVENNTDSLAIVQGDHRLTRKELALRVKTVAGALNSRMNGRKNDIAFIGPKSLSMAITMLAAMTAGCSFIALERCENMDQQIAKIDPLLIISEEVIDLPGRYSSVLFSELKSDGLELYSPEGQDALAHKMSVCFKRFVSPRKGGQELRSMTHFTMMNWQFYTELSLRELMPINGDEHNPFLRMIALTNGGHDWLLPLAFSGILVLPEIKQGDNDNDSEAVSEASELTKDLGGRLVISGEISQLLKLDCSQNDNTLPLLLAVDEGLNSSEAAMLTQKFAGVVNSGVLGWGHEDLWSEYLTEEVASAK